MKRATETSSVVNAQPPAERQQLERWTLDTFGELHALRGSLHQVIVERISDGGARRVVSERLAIVATELATNAMVHAGPPTTVRLFRTRTSFVVEASDNDPGTAPRIADNPALGVGGLGLRLVHDLSVGMGYHLDGGTKWVWAEVGTRSS
ncbi:ATP-binding protein [Actinoplanes sp. NPDC051633]|uniref:ATP-binding protein n=1 Tax=Actinoplanes sp. NPDC051633 TaxID=3155670 RepID=UPI003448AB3A